jgi:PadR family transcriptional regulator
MNELIILASLLPGPSYGYAIKKTAGMSQGKPELHPNIVYPLLRRFVSRGWVSQRVVPGERGQDRKLYRLTEGGRAELKRRLEAFDEGTAANSDQFLVRAGLFDLITPQARERVLQLRRAHLESAEQQLRALRRGAQPSGFPVLVLEFARRRMTQELDLIDQLERRVRSEDAQRIAVKGSRTTKERA